MSSQPHLSFDPNEHPHNRYNPLTDEWVLVCPHRAKRPWKGQTEKKSGPIVAKQNDPLNSLCPGATRSNGVQNPLYTDTFVFDNDFPALFEYECETGIRKKSGTNDDEIGDDLFRYEPAKGECKVMCFHPLSSVTLATMDHVDIVKVIDKWLEIYAEMKTRHEWVQIFENKGAIMGCSNPHPHCQIWSCDFLPDLIDKKNKAQQKFARKHSGKTLLVEYLKRELTCGERVVCENENWAVLVPYWAIWPFETMILPKRHIVRLDELTRVEVDTLAQLMKQLLVKYDNLFECEFPYSMGFHFAPSGRFLNDDMSHWQLHLSYVPPLLRSAEVKKFMVGFELLAQPQRDLTPEKAAAQLRELSGSVHYSQKGNES